MWESWDNEQRSEVIGIREEQMPAKIDSNHKSESPNKKVIQINPKNQDLGMVFKKWI